MHEPEPSTEMWTGGWHNHARHVPSPNFGLRPDSAVIDLVVVHSISLPPGQYGGQQVQARGLGRLDVCRAHPAVVEAVTTQLSTLGHVSNLYIAEPPVQLAEQLLRHLGKPGKVFLCNSGAEANEAAFKLARRTGRKNIIAAENSFHGRTMGALAMTGGSAAMDRVTDGTAIDAGGLVPDEVSHNSWVARIGQVDPLEMLEVQLCNATAPFILIDRLRSAMEAATARRRYIVNVSAMEGVFGRGYKGPGHPHTNMAKAALNMLTRTAAGELAEHGILMTAVDTGWITDERPHTTKVRLADEGFHAPLDLVDGAARVYDPIVQGENGVDLYGCFLKNYVPSAW